MENLDDDEPISSRKNYNECYLSYRQTKINNRLNRMAKNIRNQLLRFDDEDDLSLKLKEIEKLKLMVDEYVEEIKSKIQNNN